MTVVAADRNIILVFEKAVKGLARRYRRRLELLGYTIVISPYIHDFQVEKYARKIGGIIVTYDRDFEKTTNAIVLDINKSYEEQITQLLKKLAERAGGRCDCHLCRWRVASLACSISHAAHARIPPAPAIF